MDTSGELYQKYRPSNLGDVVGHNAIIQTLKQASINNAFSHAYLLSGNRGCGKTSTARILATLMNCENPKEGISCGKCRACQTIPRDASVDVKELNGAGSGKVADIDKIIDAAQWPPTELKKKIFIIDECHRVTSEAQSNLLKIVEEPPPYVSFIFCTTEPNKMKETIIDRCQRFNFNKLLSKDITKRLHFISQSESINIENQALFDLAKISHGSMRNAIKKLQQIATVAQGKQILSKHIQQYFGIADRRAIINIIKAMTSKNAALVMDQVNDLIVASVQTQGILYELSETLRHIQMIKIPNIDKKLLDLPDYEIEELQKVSESLKLSQIVKMAHIFDNVSSSMQYHINERWIMEATLIDCMLTTLK